MNIVPNDGERTTDSGELPGVAAVPDNSAAAGTHTFTATAAGLRLSEHDLGELRNGSGACDEIIRTAGVYASPDAADNGHHLRWTGPATKLGECLAFPVPDPAGVSDQPLYTVLKPRNPRQVTKDGKARTIKFEHPKGTSAVPYILPTVRDGLNDPAGMVLLTEGYENAMLLVQHGYCAVGILGVWQCLKKTAAVEGEPAKWELCPEFAAFAWTGRTVAIVFGSDAVHDPMVKAAELRWSEAFAAAGANVVIVRIPPGVEDATQESGSFIKAHGAEAFAELVADAQPADLKADAVYWPNDSKQLAKRHLGADREDDVYTRRYHRGDHWKYRDGAYEMVSADELDSTATLWLMDEYERMSREEQQAYRDGKIEREPKPAYQATMSAAKELTHAIKALTTVPASLDTPVWLFGESPFDPGNAVACRNGILDVTTRKFVPASPRYFTTAATAFDYDPAAPPPALFLETLSQYWPDEPDSIALLQEWCGYVLTADTSQQKLLYMIGPPRSGKGTIIRVLMALVGLQNCASMQFTTFVSDFGMSMLLGKSLCIVADGRLERADASEALTRVLNITGEDAQPINRKYQSLLTAKLPTRLTFASNELPDFRDPSGAIASRMLMLKFTNSFIGRTDTTLTDRLKAELPGILLWALEGLVRLRANGRFTEPAASRDVAEQFMDLVSPHGQFAREKLVVDPTARTVTDEVVRLWRDWCDASGHEPGNVNTFARHLTAAVPMAQKIRARVGTWLGTEVGTEHGTEQLQRHARAYFFSGIRPRTQKDDADDLARESVPTSVPGLSQATGTENHHENKAITSLSHLSQDKTKTSREREENTLSAIASTPPRGVFDFVPGQMGQRPRRTATDSNGGIKSWHPAFSPTGR